MVSSAFEGSHQDSEPGRVDETHLGQVDHDAPAGVVTDHLGQGPAQGRRRGGVQLPHHPDDWQRSPGLHRHLEMLLYLHWGLLTALS